MLTPALRSTPIAKASAGAADSRIEAVCGGSGVNSATETLSETEMGAVGEAAPVGGDDPVEALIQEARAGKRLGPGRTLRGATLVDRDLSGANLTGVDLCGADLSRANLTRANLVGAKLEGAVLFGATLDHAELLGADLRGADLTQASAKDAGFGGANLEGANLFNTVLTGATFTQANLTGADLRTADLTATRIRESCLRDADCSGAVLRGTDLGDSDVTGASFKGANLCQSRLTGVRGATEANWIGADLPDVDFCGAYLVRRHILDQNYLHEFRSQSRTTEAVYWVWWATSDCGRSFVRWGLWTAVLAVLFAGLYQFVELDLGGRPDNWMTTIYFSFVTLTTLGYGDIVPTSAGARIVALVEVIIGYMMLGGLLGIFANKMARRAE